MAEITVVAANVDTPRLEQCHVERGTLAAAAAPGDWVYLGASGFSPALADALETSHARGMVVSDGFGSTAFAAGQVVDIVVRGRVNGFTGMTPGGVVYVSPDTAGAGDQTIPDVGEFPCIGGYAWDATTIMVEPQTAIPVEVPA